MCPFCVLVSCSKPTFKLSVAHTRTRTLSLSVYIYIYGFFTYRKYVLKRTQGHKKDTHKKQKAPFPANPRQTRKITQNVIPALLLVVPVITEYPESNSSGALIAVIK